MCPPTFFVVFVDEVCNPPFNPDTYNDLFSLADFIASPSSFIERWTIFLPKQVSRFPVRTCNPCALSGSVIISF